MKPSILVELLKKVSNAADPLIVTLAASSMITDVCGALQKEK